MYYEQVFNRFITFQLLSDAYYDDTGLPLDEGDEITFDYDMFRRMHYQYVTVTGCEKLTFVD